MRTPVVTRRGGVPVVWMPPVSAVVMAGGVVSLVRRSATLPRGGAPDARMPVSVPVLAAVARGSSAPEARMPVAVPVMAAVACGSGVPEARTLVAVPVVPVVPAVVCGSGVPEARTLVAVPAVPVVVCGSGVPEARTPVVTSGCRVPKAPVPAPGGHAPVLLRCSRTSGGCGGCSSSRPRGWRSRSGGVCSRSAAPWPWPAWPRG
ncbi:hypothetical protein [Nocardia higoensis]|uniref:hypothetical protein n=1 Tax=Nocardia higoensis TaxID=228599 RepID=UPI000593436B|nr:hypothetical protein [Nocardia higoensis]